MAEYIIDIPDSVKRIKSNEVDTHAKLMGLNLRENIIRCRDCKHYQPCSEDFFICMRGWVVAVNDCGWEHELHVEVDPNGFCAWAERDE